MAPRFIKRPPSGNQPWTAVATCEIMHKDFGNAQSCLIANGIPFTSDYFDGDEPDNKNIVLRVEKSKVADAQKLLKEDSKALGYSIFPTEPIESIIRRD